MSNTIKHKRGSGSNPSASDLVAGEIAIRTDTGVLFTKKDDNSVVSISGGSTNLGVSTTSSAVTVTSSTGNNATISEATGSAAGVMSTAHHDKLDGIEANATADQSASEILTAIKTVDGTGSGLDADTLDGVQGSSFLRSDAADTKSSGDLSFSDNVKAVFGGGSDLQIYHDGNNSYIKDDGSGNLIINATNLSVKNAANNANYFNATDGGAFTAYHNNVYKFQTKSDGVNVVGEVQCDSLDVDGSADITGNVVLHNHLDLGDNNNIRIGAGDDLQIFHDGSNSVIRENGTGALTIQSNGGEIAVFDFANSQNMGRFITAGAVELYHNGAKKLETSSSGISVTGNVVVSGTVDGRDVASDGSKLDGIAAGAQVNVGTNLSRTTTASANTIVSSTGNNVTLTEATNSAAGLMTTAHHSKLDGIESGATADQSASEILTAIKTVDGASSGLDADLLDGQHGSHYLNYNNFTNTPTIPTNNNQLTNGAGYITATLTNEQVQDIVGAMLSGNTESGITVTYQDGDGTIDFSVASQTDNNFTTTLKNKLDGIESGATADQSASEILTLIKTVDGSGSGLDADTVDGINSASFLRSDTADTASGDILFSGGAGAVSINAHSDIRLSNGNWTGNHAGKIQHHGNWLYIQGGSNGIVLRSGPGTDRAYVDSSGNFKPAANNSYDLGTSSNQWRDGYFDGTVNADGLDIDGNGDISGSLTLHGNLDLQDSDTILLGTGDDLQIYHNASDSYITNATGELVVINYANDEDIVLATDNGSGGIIDYVRCDGSVGEVKLYYYGSQKFNTKSDGVNVVGECECDSLDVDGNADIAGNITLSASNPTLTFSGGCNINSPSANNLDFLTNGTDRMRITPSGDVRIRNFTPRIGASISSVSSNFSAYFAAQGTGGGNLPVIVERYNDNGVAIEFKRNNAVVGNINVTPTTTNYVTSSDYRLKENVVDLDDAITRVKQLAPKRFNFTVEPDVTVDGFLAHEAQTVVPEAVTGTHNEVQVWDANDQDNGDLPDGVSVGDNKLDEDGNTIPVYQGIDQAKLVPLLTAALQEAITKIETLEAKVAALESA